MDSGSADIYHRVISSSEELQELYGHLFGSSTGVDQTLIDDAEVSFFGPRLATIKTSLRHMASDHLHDKQEAIYSCIKLNDRWVFVSHLSIDSNA